MADALGSTRAEPSLGSPTAASTTPNVYCSAPAQDFTASVASVPTPPAPATVATLSSHTGAAE